MYHKVFCYPIGYFFGIEHCPTSCLICTSFSHLLSLSLSLSDFLKCGKTIKLLWTELNIVILDMRIDKWGLSKNIFLWTLNANNYPNGSSFWAIYECNIWFVAHFPAEFSKELVNFYWELFIKLTTDCWNMKFVLCGRLVSHLC